MTRSASVRADRWLCDICGKDYSSKGNLQRHQENIHGFVEDAERDREGSPASTATGISVHQLPKPDDNTGRNMGRRGRKRKRLSVSEIVDAPDMGLGIESEEEDGEGRENGREDSCVLRTPPPPDAAGMHQNENSGEKMIVNGNEFLRDIAGAGITEGDSMPSIGDAAEPVENGFNNNNNNHEGHDNENENENENDNDNDSVTDMILNQIPSHPYPPSAQQYTPTSPSFGPVSSNPASSQLQQLTRENRTLRYKLEMAVKELTGLREEKKRHALDMARLRRNNKNLLQMVNDYAKMEDGYQ